MKNARRIDWSAIAALYREIRSTLEPVRLPSDQEIKSYKALASIRREHRTDLAAQFDLGYMYHPGGPEYRRQIDDFNAAVASGGAHELSGSRSIYDVIEEGIAKKRMSTEFLEAWGFLHVLVGSSYELLEQDDRAREDFRKGIEGARGNVDLQKAWYSHWMLLNMADRNRGIVEGELAVLCGELWRNEREFPAGFKPEWFEKLIVQESLEPVPRNGPCEPVQLRSSFTKLGLKTLKALASKFPPEDLPPLSPSAFALTSRNP